MSALVDAFILARRPFSAPGDRAGAIIETVTGRTFSQIEVPTI